MLTVGITGGSGCGKGYVARLLEKSGIKTLDTDAGSRIVYAPGQACYSELVERFGEGILDPEGNIDRKRLFTLTFEDTGAYAELNRIAHFHILNYCREWLKQRAEAGNKVACIDAPLLYESGFDKECGIVVAVSADRETRLRRIIERDGISREDAALRLLRQKDDEFYTERADYVIYNGAQDSDTVIGQVEQLGEILNETAELLGRY